MKKSLLIFSILLGAIITMSAQVTGVKFLIEYNCSTELYDCKIVITEGQATTYPQRIQFNSQYSVVVPAGSQVYIDTLYNPIENNATYTGTIPCLWDLGPQELSPPTQPQHDFLSIIPNISPPSAYNNLAEGDTVTLFGLSIDVDPSENAVRPYESGEDPDTNEMPGGGDFSCGFTIGSGLQLYQGNLSTTYQPYFSSSTDSLLVCEGFCIELDPNISCLEEVVQYEWSTGETTETIEVCPTVPSDYTLWISDDSGIILDSMDFHVGFDSIAILEYPEMACAGESIILSACPAAGTWSQASSNGFGASLAQLPGGETMVTFSTFVSGTFDFHFTALGIEKTISIYVNPNPLVNIADDEICVGQTTILSANTSDGYWVSSDPTVAYVTNSNEAYGLNEGTVTFSYTDAVTGCFNTTTQLLVTYNGVPAALPDNVLCIGETAQAIPASGGTWTSADNDIVTVTSGGLVQAIGGGTTTVVYTESASGCNSEPISVTVIPPPPTELIGPSNICIGETTLFSPSSGGTWQSANIAIATIDNSGIVTGVGAGITNFTFTDTQAGCPSLPSDPVTVGTLSMLAIQDTELCVGENTVLSSDASGTWVSNNPAIATVNVNSGIVTAHNEGIVSFTFTNIQGCSQLLPDQLTVFPNTGAQLTGPSEICIGNTTTVTASTNGVWQSSDPLIATIDNAGLVTGLNEGTVSMTFTDFSGSLCISNPIEITVSSVLGAPNVYSNGPVCEGDDLNLSTDNIPGATYQWTGPNGFTSNEQNPQFESAMVLDAGTYCLVVTVDGCESLVGCNSLIVNPIPNTPIANTNGPVCEGEDIALATAAVPNAIYLWTGPNGFNSTDQNPVITNANPADAGSYCVIILVDGCESLEECTDVVVNWTPATPQVTSNGPLCEGGDLELVTDAVPGGIYLWSGPNAFTSTDQNPIITNVTAAESGDYCLRVLIDGCESEEGCTSVNINNTSTSISATSNGPVCEGEDISLTTDTFVGASYSWTGPNNFISTQQNPTISGADASDSGTYCVIASFNGCESEEACTDVIVNYTPATPVAANNGPLCEGYDINLITNAVTDGTYYWTGPNGFISSDQNPTIIQATPSQSGRYCVVVSVDGCESLEGCTDIIVNPIPSTPIVNSNDPICEGEDIELSTNAVANGTYSWTGPNSFISTDQNPIIFQATSSQSGSYCVVVSVDGCQSEEVCTDVLVNNSIDFPTVNNNGPVCEGENIQLTTNSVINGTFTWTGPNSFVSVDQNIIIENVNANLNGTYCLVVTVEGCVSEVSCTDVVVNPTPPIPVINNSGPVCSGDDILLITDAVADANYLWNGPNGFVSFDQNPIIPSASSINAGTYTLSILNGFNECQSDEASIDIEVINCFEPFEACEQIGSDDIICDYSVLGSIVGILSDEVSEGNQPPGSLCDNDGEAQNATWFGFVALEGDYELVINSLNCTELDGSVGGVKIGVYSDCSFSEESVVYCETTFNSEIQTRIASSYFTTGETYFLSIDGYNGSICEYSIEVDGFYDNTYCTDLSKVTGVAYIDDNENGIYEVGEILLRNALISLSPGNMSVLTNDEGKYIINTPKGGATLTAKMNEGYWINDEIIIEDLTIFEQCVEGINFGFVPNLFYQEAKISVANSITRCDWETRFYFTVENTGTMDIDANFTFDFDSKASYFATNLIGLQVNGNKASGDLGTIKPFEVREYWIKLKMPSGSTVLPMLDFKTTLFNSADAELDAYEQREQLRCSYDPNDKREFPNREGEENLTLMDEELEYTIRFQNNGNDTAFLVKIVDPLDPNIEPSSIRVINSSHSVETCIENENLIFLFENINLVDSMTNYDGSQGFVSFRCNTKEGRAENTIVNNTADIIFDTNVPIVTNTTINTLVSVLCTDMTNEVDIEICAGESYNGYEETGVYTEVFPLQYGCDSTVLINLVVQGITYSSQDIEMCAGEAFELNGEEYILFESQEIVDTIINGQGCISNVRIFDITVNPILNISIDTTICFGMSYEGFTEPGSYTIETFDEVTGCDVNINLNLEIHEIIYSIQASEACEGQVFDLNGNEYILNESQEIRDTILNAQGCISDIIIFDVEVIPTIKIDVDTIICEGMEYEGLTESGIYTIEAVDDITGCDIITTIDLEVLAASDPLCIVSTEDELINNIKVYPNPALNQFFVEGQTSIEAISIYSMAYQKIENVIVANGSNKVQISTENLNQGLYIISIKSDGRFIFKKLIVQ